MRKPLISLIILIVAAVVGWFVYDKYGVDNPMATGSLLVPYSPFETQVQSKEIEVYLPTPGTTNVGTKFVIYGKGRGFENTLNYRISDDYNNQLYVGFLMTDAPDSGIFGYFNVAVDLTKILKTVPSVIRLDVYEASAKDGSDIHKTSFRLQVDQ